MTGTDNEHQTVAGILGMNRLKKASYDGSSSVISLHTISSSQNNYDNDASSNTPPVAGPSFPAEFHDLSPSETKSKNNVTVYQDDSLENNIPNGGSKAWLVVFGAFCANITTVGFINTTGTIQEYLMTHQLKDYSDSSVGWVFSLFNFLMYFGSIQTGPFIDAYGVLPVLIPGSVLWCASLFIMSVCDQYYQFILGFSVLGGIATSFIMNPSFTVVNHWFTSKKSIALSIVAAGGSLGGCFLPIVLSTLFNTIGYGWTIRVLAFFMLALSVIACLLMRSRTTKHKVIWRELTIDISSLKEPAFAFCCLGLLLSEWAYFLPALFIVNYAKMAGFTDQGSNLMLVYMNITSSFARIFAGVMAKWFGTYNVMIVSTIMAGLSSLCIWIPAGTSYGTILAFAVVFGFFSGSCMSIAPLTVSHVASVSNYGKRYGTAYAIVSLGVLTSLPIGGALTGDQFFGCKVATGVAFLASAAAFAATRFIKAGRNPIF